MNISIIMNEGWERIKVNHMVPDEDTSPVSFLRPTCIYYRPLNLYLSQRLCSLKNIPDDKGCVDENGPQRNPWRCFSQNVLTGREKFQCLSSNKFSVCVLCPTTTVFISASETYDSHRCFILSFFSVPQSVHIPASNFRDMALFYLTLASLSRYSVINYHWLPIMWSFLLFEKEGRCFLQPLLQNRFPVHVLTNSFLLTYCTLD